MYKQFWKSHKGCGIEPSAMDLITRMIHATPEKRISIQNIKKHTWYINKNKIASNELQNIFKLLKRKHELKRINDPIKQQILFIETKYGSLKQELLLKEKKLKLNQKAPDLTYYDNINLLDVFSQKPAYKKTFFLSCQCICHI